MFALTCPSPSKFYKTVAMFSMAFISVSSSSFSNLSAATPNGCFPSYIGIFFSWSNPAFSLF